MSKYAVRHSIFRFDIQFHPISIPSMSSLLTLLMLVILFACVATLYAEGMWSNAIRLINVVTAALLATNFFEPLARWLEDMGPSYTYVCDFLALWVLFGVFLLILRWRPTRSPR